MKISDFILFIFSLNSSFFILTVLRIFTLREPLGSYSNEDDSIKNEIIGKSCTKKTLVLLCLSLSADGRRIFKLLLCMSI